MNNATRISPEAATKARQALNLSQAKVAHDIEINRAYLSQFEHGKRVLDSKILDSLRAYYEDQGWAFSEDGDDPTHTMHIVDGFVVSAELADEAVEPLVEEYYRNADRMAELERDAVKRGFFGGVAEDDALEQAQPLLLLAYRQYYLKQALQGAMEREATLAENDRTGKAITLLGDYLNHLVKPHNTIQDPARPAS